MTRSGQSNSRRITFFDLALVDYEMPIMSGARLVEELKFIMPDVPVVLLSGRKDIPKSTWCLSMVISDHTQRSTIS